MATHQEERVERALNTMLNAGLTPDQIKEIVAAIAEMHAHIAKESINGR